MEFLARSKGSSTPISSSACILPLTEHNAISCLRLQGHRCLSSSSSGKEGAASAEVCRNESDTMELLDKHSIEAEKVGDKVEEQNGMKSPGQERPRREHMFEKAVTPSDVGKLNRLVIPKQHAEKYFPLDSNANEKGLVLSFEDSGGNSWRFRYSYWNSSQSYVLTKGWSRFVKDKKLDAGDIVSFEREIVDSSYSAGAHTVPRNRRLFISWTRRPKLSLGQHEVSSKSPLNLPLLRSSPFSSPYSNFNGQYYADDCPTLSRVCPRWFPFFSPENRTADVAYMQPGTGTGTFRGDFLTDASVQHTHAMTEEYLSAKKSHQQEKLSTKKGVRLFGVNLECASATVTVADELSHTPSKETSCSERLAPIMYSPVKTTTMRGYP
eukprot:TRINITY_DN29004_c0_g1_i1.p1 TRINITY_DN29004_c0_g1~~TRINITY_DN29004_c0_g1_i1.p1  ORF type:complete len:381 (+),score=41.75 TRINITY_DN29004_c0_g1_i1:233-1375(+)